MVMLKFIPQNQSMYDLTKNDTPKCIFYLDKGTQKMAHPVQVTPGPVIRSKRRACEKRKMKGRKKQVEVKGGWGNNRSVETATNK